MRPRRRITVFDVLGWLAAGMTLEEILADYPELTEEDIRACLAYAADRKRSRLIASIESEAASRSKLAVAVTA